MVEKNDALLRELSEEVRADEFKKLWDRYKLPIIAAIAAIPLGTLGWQLYDGQRRATSEAAGARFEAARQLLAEKKSADADKAFAEIAADGPAGYASLAELHAAASLVKSGKTAEAVATYDRIAAGNAGTALTDMARLQAASLRLGAADWTEMQNRLTTLTDERSAYRALARELLGLAALKAGKVEDARRAFLQVLTDTKASPALKDRINTHMTGLIAADVAKSAPAGTVTPAAGAGAPAAGGKN